MQPLGTPELPGGADLSDGGNVCSKDSFLYGVSVLVSVTEGSGEQVLRGVQSGAGARVQALFEQGRGGLVAVLGRGLLGEESVRNSCMNEWRACG